MSNTHASESKSSANKTSPTKEAPVPAIKPVEEPTAAPVTASTKANSPEVVGEPEATALEGKRAITVVIPARTYNMAKTLANLTGTSVSGMISGYLLNDVRRRLRAELTRVERDLG